MSAEVRLEKLLQNLDPRLQGETWVFSPMPPHRLAELADQCLCLFREREGACAILPRVAAERAGLEHSGAFRQITLQVHSSLDAVGLTAAVAGELAQTGISANVVAALRHDHIFVPEQDAQRALQVLRGLANRAQYT
ncbi:ACT domain-containing protein [Microbulbifer sp. SAOS-129_SWC]|uniref:ACT domain-containing protein n=1 Tax=Microbulbifer sp. SAOS-129_SWC TaxID=3145235 RepID=UPI003216C870